MQTLEPCACMACGPQRTHCRRVCRYNQRAVWKTGLLLGCIHKLCEQATTRSFGGTPRRIELRVLSRPLLILRTQLRSPVEQWHQDYAAAELAHMFDASRTVMFAFPAAGVSNHDGTGIFTELIGLTHEFYSETLKTTTDSYQGFSTAEQDKMAALDLGVSENHIVRPRFGRGQELLRYKDSEHLHRSPRSTSDPSGRARQAIWRFQ